MSGIPFNIIIIDKGINKVASLLLLYIVKLLFSDSNSSFSNSFLFGGSNIAFSLTII